MRKPYVYVCLTTHIDRANPGSVNGVEVENLGKLGLKRLRGVQLHHFRYEFFTNSFGDVLNVSLSVLYFGGMTACTVYLLLHSDLY